LYDFRASTSQLQLGSGYAVVPHKIPHTCHGYILHCSLQPRFSSAIHIVGVYLPNDATYKHCREDIYMHLSSLVTNHNPDHTNGTDRRLERMSYAQRQGWHADSH
jgi:hypothetical protein